VRRTALTGLVVLATMLGSVVAASTAGAATRAPRESSTIAGVTSTVVSCGSPTACLAVGAAQNSEGDVPPVAYALEKTKWKTVAVRVPKVKGAIAAELDAVSCKAATYCLAYGDTWTGDNNDYPFFLTWNGTSFTRIAAPPHADSAVLQVIDCTGVRSCLVLGAGAESNIDTTEFIWTLSGTRWTTRKVSLPVAYAAITALHCTSLTFCEVAGDYQPGTSGGTVNPLLAAWNGNRFILQSAAAVPSGLDFGEFTDISCSSERNCAAVGIGISGTGPAYSSIMEKWNGATWTAEKWSGPKGSRRAVLTGVSCTSATNCVAVGFDGTGSASRAASLVWNGTKWLTAGVPSVGKRLDSALDSVSCPKTGACEAIGVYGPATAENPKPLAAGWNGKAWKLTTA